MTGSRAEQGVGDAAAQAHDEPVLRRVLMDVCDPCLDGVGGECHVPGCAFWMIPAPQGWIRELLNERRTDER